MRGQGAGMDHKRITISLPASLLKQIAREARIENRSVSGQVRHILEREGLPRQQEVEK